MYIIITLTYSLISSLTPPPFFFFFFLMILLFAAVYIHISVSMQKSVFPTMGISRKLGNEGMATLQTTYAQDEELIAVCKEFALKCSATWVESKFKKKHTHTLLFLKNLVCIFMQCVLLFPPPRKFSFVFFLIYFTLFSLSLPWFFLIF